MLKRWVHGTVLRTRGLPGLSALYRGAYRVALEECGRVFRTVPGVAGVWLHRGMSRRAWEPGVSDIDLILLREPSGAPEGEWGSWAALAAARAELKRAFPMLGDLWVGDAAELRNYLHWGGLRVWEDAPHWTPLAGQGPSSLGRPESLEDPVKRRWLDPWAWALVSFMEVSRRLFQRGKGNPGKTLADTRKLFLDFWRYTGLILDEGEPAPESPRSRAETFRGLPELEAWSPRELWLRAARRLGAASRKVLEKMDCEGRAAVHFPGPVPGSGESERLQALLAASPAVRGAVCDPPYHSYALMDEEAGDADYGAVWDRFRKGDLPGVPLALSSASWALCLQSAYLGAPLGWIGHDGPVPREGLFSDWSPCALGGTDGPVPLLSERPRWEVAAEAASWMALWWRYLWIDPLWENRFALFHLYTRSLGLRLTLAGAPSGPFCDLEGLCSRAASSFPEEAVFCDSLRRFSREEPRECVEALPRASLAPGHPAGLAAQMSALQRAMEAGTAPCSAR